MLPAESLALHAALLGAGIAAGFINTMAGGGSLLTLPALMLLGLPPNVANGTNRLAVVSQSLLGVLSFHREGKLHTKAMVPVTAPAVLGAIAGAVVAAIAPPEILEPVLLGTMIAMALVMLLMPKLVMAEPDEVPRSPWKHFPSWLGLFGAGVYGGFVQAGVGFVLLAVLGGLLRYDAVRANALKLVCTLVFTLPALAIFVVAGQVEWIPAVLLALGTMMGSFLGVRFAVKANRRVLHAIIVAMVIASCVAAFLKD